MTIRKEREKRDQEYALNGEGCFILDVQHPKSGSWYCLDATRTFDTFGRLINHSRTPNLKALQAVVNGILRVGFLATCEITPNSQLFFNYGTQPNAPAWFKSPTEKVYKYCS